MSQRYTILAASKTEATSIVAAASKAAAAAAHTGGDQTRVLDWAGWTLGNFVIINGPSAPEQQHIQVYNAEQTLNDLVSKLENGTMNKDEWFQLFRILGTYTGPPLIEGATQSLDLAASASSIQADGSALATFTITKVGPDGTAVGSGTETVVIDLSAPCQASAVQKTLVAGSATFTITSQNGIRGTVYARCRVAGDVIGRSEPVGLTFE